MPISLECTIEAQAEYRLGDPINVTGILRNTGQTGVWILNWNTFFDGMRGNFARLALNGVQLPYDGPFIRRGNPTQNKYMLIPPGGSASATVDLSAAYPISQPGAYEASFVLHMNDAFEEGAEAPPRTLDNHEPIKVVSPSITFVVTPGGDPLPTKGERARKKSPIAAPAQDLGAVPLPKDPIVPIIIGANSSQTQELHTAYNWSYQSVLKSLQTLQSSTISSNPTYDTWFGTYSAANAQTITAVYTKIAAWMTGAPITLDLTDPDQGCDSDVYAWTYFNTSTVYFCDLFFEYFDWYWAGNSEQAEVIVHEAAHAAASIDDIVYGEPASADLAETDPSQAINNADNYGYFSIDLYPETPPKNNGVWTQDSSLTYTTNVKPGAAASTEAGSLILSWQDSNSSKNWLWVREWNIAQNSWGKRIKLYNAETGQPIKTLAGPALAAVGDVFYLLYNDGDSPGSVAYIYSSDNGVHWSKPQQAFSDVDSTKSPAIISNNGTLSCVYVGSDGFLYSIGGTPTDGGVTWGLASTSGYQSEIEPGLGVFNGQFYCLYTLGGPSIRILTSTNGYAWTTGGFLPESITSGSPALIQWNSTYLPEPVLMCLYRGLEPDRNLHYTIFDGVNWTYQFRESGNRTAAGPTLVAYGSVLYNFHRGASNNKLYWSHTVTSPNQT